MSEQEIKNMEESLKESTTEQLFEYQHLILTLLKLTNEEISKRHYILANEVVVYKQKYENEADLRKIQAEDTLAPQASCMAKNNVAMECK